MEATMAVDAPTVIRSIDQVLGAARGRFFGDGYRHVRRKLGAVECCAEHGEVSGKLAIFYPETWSAKQHKELKPHLSSIDALVTSVQLVEVYLRVAGRMEDLSRVWLERCVLKAGPSAVTSLEEVPVSCRRQLTEHVTGALHACRSRFQCQVGSMKVDLVVTHPEVNLELQNGYVGDTDEFLGGPEHAYYGGAFARERLDIYDIEVEHSCKSVSASFDVLAPVDHLVTGGLGAAYYPFASELTTIVGVAQLAQVLLYRYDELTRENSNNLWMRKIDLRSALPAPSGHGMTARTWSKSLSLLPVKGEVWRVGEFGLELPGVIGDYALAHQLPSLPTGEGPQKRDRARAGLCEEMAGAQ